MARTQNPNLDILTLAVDQLGTLTDDMVFLGGCATGLLITDPAAPPIRVTRDVDAIVQIYSQAEYYGLAEKLRARGFKEDTRDDAPVCRWISGAVVLDVMPTDPEILGFGNLWYEKALEHSLSFKLPGHKSIKLVTAPYFLITKLEAFRGRGYGDYMLSHDIEDVVAVLDGRPEVISEIKASGDDLTTELSRQFKMLQAEQRFLDAVSGHMPTDEASQARVPRIIELIKLILEL